MRKRIAKHPVLSFVLATVIWSWSVWSFMLFVIRPGELLITSKTIVYLFVILGGLGPSLIGCLLTYLLYGRKGLQRIQARFTIRGVGMYWLSIFIIPATTFLTILMKSFFGTPLRFDSMKDLLIPGLLLGLSAGVMEELGWRGFLLPHLLKQYSPFHSTLLVGLIWGGVWHGYADYLGLGNKWLLIILLGPLLLTAWSFILTSMYEKTKGNILLSIALHASISSSALIFGIQYSSYQEELLWSIFSVLLAYLVAVPFFFLSNRVIYFGDYAQRTLRKRID